MGAAAYEIKPARLILATELKQLQRLAVSIPGAVMHTSTYSTGPVIFIPQADKDATSS